VDDASNVRVFREDAFQKRPIRDVTRVRNPIPNKFGPPSHERIQDHGRVPVVQQGAADGAADITRSAGDENFHGFYFAPTFFRQDVFTRTNNKSTVLDGVLRF
jgi:hypothetical protein